MRKSFYLAPPLCLALSACASGDGGGMVQPGPLPGAPGPNVITIPPPVPFTDWVSVTNGGNVALNAVSREAAFTKAPPGSVGVVAIDAPTGAAFGATLTERFSGTGAIADIGIGPAATNTVNFNVGPNSPAFAMTSTRDQRLYRIGDFEDINVGFTGNAAALNWNYQTFGIWSVSLIFGNARGELGVLTAGVTTAAAGVPVTGSANYTGFAAGNYTSSDKPTQVVTATASVTVDFAQRSVGLSLTDSAVIPPNSGSAVPNSNLNLSGTLSFTPGSIAFAGAVATPGGGVGNAPMSGTSTGLFYGPAAAEVGGVFWVTGGAGSAYAGGFGAKK